MELLNDEIHKCKECGIYKKYGEMCSLQPELTVLACEFCDTRSCCIMPAAYLMPCEENTILDKIDNDDEYALHPRVVPFNRKNNYCKHMNTTTMKCKVYSVRPICCRIAGDECMGESRIRFLKMMRGKLKCH